MSAFTKVFAVGSRRLRTVMLTSGAGTYTPTTFGNLHVITLLGAGANGQANNNGAGGQAGHMRIFTMRVQSPVPYIVGAAGPQGGYSMFAGVQAAGGLGGVLNDFYAITYQGGAYGTGQLPNHGDVGQDAFGWPGHRYDGPRGGASLYGFSGSTPAPGSGYGFGGAASTDPAKAAAGGGLILVEEYA